MDYSLRESAILWLKEKGFDDSEVEELQAVLNKLDLHTVSKDELVILPKQTSKKIAAMVYLLNLITDADGKRLCCDEKGLIEIPEEAKDYYGDELELEELEGAIGKLQKAKVGRMHSSPKRRGSVKDERY
jgi:hypothetical protein